MPFYKRGSIRMRSLVMEYLLRNRKQTIYNVPENFTTNDGNHN